MKKITKIASIILALVLAFAVAIPSVAVFAAELPGSITITAPTDVSIDGKEFKAYKLLNVTHTSHEQEADRKYAYTIPGATEKNAVIAGLKAAGITTTDLSDTQLIEELGKITDDDKKQAFAKAALDSLEKAGVSAANSAIASGGKCVIDELPLGYYIVKDASELGENNPVIAAVALTTTQPGANVTAKLGSEPTLEKSLDNNNNNNSYYIGEEIDYRIVVPVPVTTGYSSYTYKVTDTLSKGLDFVDGSLKAFVGGSEDTALNDAIGTLSSPADYDLTLSSYTGTDDTTLAVNFTNIINISRNDSYAGKYIIITYKAKLNSDAIVGEDGNLNSASLEFSNNPGDSSSSDTTPPSDVYVYTFDIEIEKVDGDNTETKLANAEFVLYKTVGNKDYYYNEDGDWTEVEHGAAVPSDARKYLTDSNGKATIEKIAAGTYYLKETAAPAGYNALDSDITIEIIATLNDAGKLSKAEVKIDGGDAKEITTEKKATVPVQIKNYGGAQLPSTGGMGTTLLYILGAVLVIGAGILLVAKKRMNSHRV